MDAYTVAVAILGYLTVGMGLMLFGVCGIYVVDEDDETMILPSIAASALCWLPLLIMGRSKSE